MESLNMAKLNLSSVRNNVPAENAPPKQEVSDSKLETSSLTDPEEDYHCEYREDIWKTLLEQDAEKPTIHLQSPQLEFRGALVQQLRDVTKKLSLTLATLHSAVAQLDLFMDAHRLRADRLTHVALACLSLAVVRIEPTAMDSQSRVAAHCATASVVGSFMPTLVNNLVYATADKEYN
ncbi:jg18705 [Pararge aegeria aegeria]|uniref:Jg18705 protein n=1 Tax=Pararge aegeria aegeria TaxID=348720 RepID=A0A8S4RWL2_9NEOP|nr:jg18705 [Pararge aegeria aegeria]